MWAGAERKKKPNILHGLETPWVKRLWSQQRQWGGKPGYLAQRNVLGRRADVWCGCVWETLGRSGGEPAIVDRALEVQAKLLNELLVWPCLVRGVIGMVHACSGGGCDWA